MQNPHTEQRRRIGDEYRHRAAINGLAAADNMQAIASWRNTLPAAELDYMANEARRCAILAAEYAHLAQRVTR